MKKKFLILTMACCLIFLLTGCMPGDGKAGVNDPAGFFWGIWHGWIAPISLIVGLFNKNISIYEMFNTGWWYNFGFYISIIGGFGTVNMTRKKRKEKK